MASLSGRFSLLDVKGDTPEGKAADRTKAANTADEEAAVRDRKVLKNPIVWMDLEMTGLTHLQSPPMRSQQQFLNGVALCDAVLKLASRQAISKGIKAWKGLIILAAYERKKITHFLDFFLYQGSNARTKSLFQM